MKGRLAVEIEHGPGTRPQTLQDGWADVAGGDLVLHLPAAADLAKVAGPVAGAVVAGRLGKAEHLAVARSARCSMLGRANSACCC